VRFGSTAIPFPRSSSATRSRSWPLAREVMVYRGDKEVVATHWSPPARSLSQTTTTEHPPPARAGRYTCNHTVCR
jgi:hypothetical protein